MKVELRFFILWTMVAIVWGSISGCSRDTELLSPAPFPDDPEVFLDGFASDLNYQAFAHSKLDALSIDKMVKYRGTASMKFTVPSEGDPSGWFAGGAFVSNTGRDLSKYDALTFWAKASIPATLGVAGFGNDNTGTSRYTVELPNIPVTTIWQKYIIPIPLAEKLVQERGLFHVAAGAVNGNGYEFWIDEVQYEQTGLVAHPRPALPGQIIRTVVGDSLAIEGTRVTFDVAGRDVTVNVSPMYFSFHSSNEEVATVDERGIIRTVGVGRAEITGMLGSIEATGTITVIVEEAPAVPLTPAPTPTYPPEDVISLFSNAYTNVFVDRWSTDWDIADVTQVKIDGDDALLYTNLVFAGIEFTSEPIDATSMTHLRMDIWTPDSTNGAVFRIKLVDFGEDGVYGGGNDSEHELTFTESSNPPLRSREWITFDIPLSEFKNLRSRKHLAQLIISGDLRTVYVDNILFHK